MERRVTDFWKYAIRGAEGLRRRLSARYVAAASSSPDDVWKGLLAEPCARFWASPGEQQFLIRLEDLAQDLKQRLVQSRGKDVGHDLQAAMIEWSSRSARSDTLIHDLPFRWRSFESIALDLVEQGKGYCVCRVCRRFYTALELKVMRARVGVEYVTVSRRAICPRHHTLLEEEAHFRFCV